jgi:hypothetical protein
MAFKMIRAKFAGKCSSCGGTIARGESCLWDSSARTISHDSESVACSARMKRTAASAADNDFAGDGLDSRYEDQCAEICGR